MIMDEEIKAQLVTIAKSIEGYKEQAAKTGENEKTIATVVEKMERIQADIKDMAQKAASFNVSGVADEFGIDRKDAGKFQAGSLLKALHAKSISQKMGVALDRVEGYNGREKELGEQMITKAAEFGNDSSGGVFVPNSVLGDFVDTLRPNERVLLDAGAKMVTLPSGTGTIQLPRKLTNTSGSDLAENGAPSNSDLTWELMTLAPHRTSALSSVSNRLTFSVADYVRILREDLIKTVLLRMQLAAIYGTGAAGQVLGIKNDPKALTLALGGGSAGKVSRYTDVAKFEDQLMSANADTTGAVLITHPNVIRNMKAERVNQYSGQTGGQPVFAFQPAQMTNDQLRKQMGYEFQTLTQIKNDQTVGSDTDCADILFGRFDNLSFYTWGGMKLKVSDQATIGSLSAFTNNLQFIMADVEYDVLFRQPKELLVVTGCKTTAVTGE
jgi:HK97 family phage major capsid protein